MRVLEIILAAIAFGLAARATLSPTRFAEGPPRQGRERFLVALHDAARAGFWLAIAGLFLGFALIEDASSFQWFAVVPIVMAGTRLLAATLLARGPS